MKRNTYLCVLTCCLPLILSGCSRPGSALDLDISAIDVSLHTSSVSVASASPDSSAGTSAEASDSADSLDPVRVDTLTFESGSKESICLSWSDSTDPQVLTYTLERRSSADSGSVKTADSGSVQTTDSGSVQTTDSGSERTADSGWKAIAEFDSDGNSDQEAYSYTDPVSPDEMVQYEYRVQVTVSDPGTSAPEDGNAVYGSNILICLDPGHYSGANYISDQNGYDYSEGDFTIKVAKKLSHILKESYGVTCRLTRSDGSISLGGYSDESLDSGHISLRGEAASGCDLFFSIHTNANNDMANGYDTVNQPVNITKTVVLVNQPAFTTSYALACANAIGRRLSAVNAEIGIASESIFQEAESVEEMTAWTDSYNDQLDTPGTICYRTGDDGNDYYGVLRGSAAVGVPGFIVEHAFHTVSEMRKAAASGELAQEWAIADAQGLAEGLHLQKNEEE